MLEAAQIIKTVQQLEPDEDQMQPLKEKPDLYINMLACCTAMLSTAQVVWDKRQRPARYIFRLTDDLDKNTLSHIPAILNWMACPVRCPSTDPTMAAYRRANKYVAPAHTNLGGAPAATGRHRRGIRKDDLPSDLAGDDMDL